MNVGGCVPQQSRVQDVLQAFSSLNEAQMQAVFQQLQEQFVTNQQRRLVPDVFGQRSDHLDSGTFDMGAIPGSMNVPSGLPPDVGRSSSGQVDVFAKSEKWLAPAPIPALNSWTSREQEIIGWSTYLEDLVAWAAQASLEFSVELQHASRWPRPISWAGMSGAQQARSRRLVAILRSAFSSHPRCANLIAVFCEGVSLNTSNMNESSMMIAMSQAANGYELLRQLTLEFSIRTRSEALSLRTSISGRSFTLSAQETSPGSVVTDTIRKIDYECARYARLLGTLPSTVDTTGLRIGLHAVETGYFANCPWVRLRPSEFSHAVDAQHGNPDSGIVCPVTKAEDADLEQHRRQGHVPFHPNCLECAKGRSVFQHRRQKDGERQAEVQADFAFISSKGEVSREETSEAVKVLVMTDLLSTARGYVVVGTNVDASRRQIVQRLDHFGLKSKGTRVSLVVHSDAEVAVGEMIAKGAEGYSLLVRRAAPQQHQAIGAAERAVRELKEGELEAPNLERSDKAPEVSDLPPDELRRLKAQDHPAEPSPLAPRLTTASGSRPRKRNATLRIDPVPMEIPRPQVDSPPEREETNTDVNPEPVDASTSVREPFVNVKERKVGTPFVQAEDSVEPMPTSEQPSHIVGSPEVPREREFQLRFKRKADDDTETLEQEIKRQAENFVAETISKVILGLTGEVSQYLTLQAI
ncbi:CCHC-type domain-containing protein [Durusdinium trenchii]|uniref:CCHC-type domain-containing protein n=1 Tax=Durusdinium trenchii TaxID=1381693 RepID=A0ABP0HSE4_9DINO